VLLNLCSFARRDDSITPPMSYGAAPGSYGDFRLRLAACDSLRKSRWPDRQVDIASGKSSVPGSSVCGLTLKTKRNVTTLAGSLPRGREDAGIFARFDHSVVFELCVLLVCTGIDMGLLSYESGSLRQVVYQ
jgi:hypothetical protein